MQSMTTTNLEAKNPSNTLERQVQTLVPVVKLLTQGNQDLEQQMNLMNECYTQTKNQHDEQHNNEHNDSHLLTGDQCKKED